MARIDSLKNFLTDVADSIRAKKGTTDLISPSNFDTEIADIESGADLSEYFDGELSVTNAWQSVFIKFPALSSSSTNASFSYLYNGCPAKIIDISGLDWTNITHVQSMFGNCQNLTTIIHDEINAPKVVSCQTMFSGCNKMVDIDLSKFNFPNVNSMLQMFLGCSLLETLNIGNWDLSKITRIDNAFNNCSKLTNLQFGINLGLAYLTSVVANYSNYTLNLSKSTLLTETSLISVLLGLADIASLGVQPQQCTLGTANLAKLTSEAGQQALAQATSYGWTVS